MEKNRDKEIVKMAIKNFGCGKSYDYEDIFQTGYLGLLLAKQQCPQETLAKLAEKATERHMA